MLSVSLAVDRAPLSLGSLGGYPNPAFSNASSYNWMSLRSQSDAIAASTAYASPPMSESPSLPPGRGQGTSQRHPEIPTTVIQTEEKSRQWSLGQRDGDRLGRFSSAPIPRSHPLDLQQSSVAYGQHGQHGQYGQHGQHGQHAISTATTTTASSHNSHHASISQHNHHQTIALSPQLIQNTRPTSHRSNASQSDIHSQLSSSPKPQRKAKGHVASACVPCKRAHLRCDAQRPCSRCISNGKEDSCVDVQHKKRGRPRLRDDREVRYDPSRFQQPHDVAARRPINIYPSAIHGNSIVERQHPVPTRHAHTSEYAKNNISTSSAGSVRYQVPPVPSPQTSLSYPAELQTEPTAYLNMDLEFVKATSSFIESMGLPNDLVGRRLHDIVLQQQGSDRISPIREELLKEQKRWEPNYLPPIFDRGASVTQRLGFTAADIGRARFLVREYLPIVAANGQVHQFPLQIGLMKEASFYFVVVSLDRRPRTHLPSQPEPISNTPRVHDATLAVTNTLARTLPAPYEPLRRPRSNESIQAQAAVMHPGSRHRLSVDARFGSHQPLYSPSSSRIDFAASSSLQIPRSELPSSSSNAQAPSTSPYQLPPIRPYLEHSRSTTNDAEEQREHKRRRVTIGGLIDRPDITDKHL